MTNNYRTWTQTSKTYRRYTKATRKAALAFGQLPTRTGLHIQCDYRTNRVSNLIELVANAAPHATLEAPYIAIRKYRHYKIDEATSAALINRIEGMNLTIHGDKDNGWTIRDNGQDWAIEVTGTNKHGITATDTVTPEVVRQVVRDALTAHNNIVL